MGARPVEVSKYKMGWVMVMFDLPVMTPKERTIATQFRKSLLDDGYLMIQYSVYARSCISFEHMEKHTQRLESTVPEGGNVRILFFTDSQWEKAICVIGKDYRHDKWPDRPVTADQIEFW